MTLLDGNKRVMNSVAVENNTLYIFNAQVFERTEDPNLDEAAAVQADSYRKVVGTFDVGKSALAV
jgi:hypothetical protein